MPSGRRTSHAGPSSTPSAWTVTAWSPTLTRRPSGVGSTSTGQHVRVAHEPRDERRRRPPIHHAGRPDLFDPAFVEHHDAVRERERLALVVRHVDERGPGLTMDPTQLRLHLQTDLQVERGQRFVQQQYLRPVHEGASQRDALHLATGELVVLPVLVPVQSHEA